MEVRNPFTGDRVAEVAQATEADVHRAVAEARRRVGVHPPAVRAEILEAASRMVASRHEEFATAIMLEAGKPLAQARGEVTRCIDTLTFSAVEARTLAGEMVPMESARSGIGKLGVVMREPIGVVGAVSPFNFPLNLVAHKLGPAIAAGCPVVLKPAGQTPISALLLGRVLFECGLQSGDLAVLQGPGGSVGAALVSHPDVPMITFTGSSAVGSGNPARSTSQARQPRTRQLDACHRPRGR
ncbi:MAG: aldehyde dehydrogenase family protein [Thermoleophilia bacterium]